MSLRKNLLRKGVLNTQITFITQGFLELLADQLALSAQRSLLAVSALKSGNTDEVIKDLQMIEKTITHAVFSCQTAAALMKREDKSSVNSSDL
ncbi:MAG: hypothetical protein WC464_06310 [Bdellovibrionales bacterium]